MHITEAVLTSSRRRLPNLDAWTWQSQSGNGSRTDGMLKGPPGSLKEMYLFTAPTDLSMQNMPTTVPAALIPAGPSDRSRTVWLSRTPAA